MTHTVLIVDHDSDLRDRLVLALNQGGFRALGAHDGPSGVAAYLARRPDLVVLEMGLGVMDGLEVCRHLRVAGNPLIVFLTAGAREVDQLRVLATGTDDYLAKPFPPGLLVARVQEHLRSGSVPRAVQTHFKVGGVVVDTSTRTATAAGCEMNLTRTEFDLLALFIGAPQRIFSRDELLDGVWGSWYGDDHVVEVHISRLRRKVKAASGLRVCVAVRGIGYKFGVE